MTCLKAWACSFPSRGNLPETLPIPSAVENLRILADNGLRQAPWLSLCPPLVQNQTKPPRSYLQKAGFEAIPRPQSHSCAASLSRAAASPAMGTPLDPHIRLHLENRLPTLHRPRRCQ